MRTDDFEFAESVSSLSCLIGLLVASAPQEQKEAFMARLEMLISESEPNSIRWRLYRQVGRDVLGETDELQKL